MKPIKVCFVSLYAYHFFNPQNKSKFGGAELQLYYLATELAKDIRFKVSFIVGDFGQKSEEIRFGVGIFKSVSLKRKVKFLTGVLLFIKLIYLLCFKIKPDVYIQRAAGIETFFVALIAKLTRRKFIYMAAHQFDTERKNNYGMGILRWNLFKIGLKLADIIISQSKEQQAALVENFKRNSIVRQSAHPIEDKIDLLRKSGVLWVARCDKWKRPELFIKLAKALPSEKFVIICPVSGDKVFFDEIKNVALTLPNLKFIDYVPFNEIDDYFAKAKVFINTSKTEGFPNTFVQAAKNKTPILSLSVNPDGILEKYAMGKSFNGDFDGMKSFLTGLLNDSTLLDEMAENGYRYAKANHDLEKIVEEDKKWIMEPLTETRCNQ